MDSVPKYQGKALLKMNSTSIVCQLRVINSSLIITNIGNNENSIASLDIRISFAEMEYSIRWVLQNQMINEMIVASQVKRFSFFPIENSLSLLKPFLDGQIPYRDFSSMYRIDKQIKQLIGGRVMKVINQLTNQVEVAKQIYFGSDYDPIHNKIVYNEISMAKYFTQFPHKNFLHNLVSQFPDGLPSEKLRKIMKTILKAIKHMHQHKIMHRDIKMDNILMRDINEPKSIVIIDYGFATSVELDNQIISKCGTPGYIAPEVVDNQKYNELCDIYSVAQVFRILLNKKSNDLQMAYVTPLLFDLLLQMNQDQEFRPSAQECLDHDFFTEYKIENKVKRLSVINLKNPFLR